MSADTTTSTAPAGAVLEQVDPAELLVDLNIRRESAADKTLTDSVRDLGVLVPIVAVTTEQGPRVRYGHRRTLAAIAAGQPTVPVWLVDPAVVGDDEVDRIVRQYAENEHRTSLTDADRLGAVEQLAAFGVSAAQISKKLKTKRATVDAALTVAGSALARGAAERYDFLDLTQAATVAEFEDDPEAVEALVAAAKSGQFDHVAQRLRDDRADEQRRQAVAGTLREAGVPVLDDPPGYDFQLAGLTDADGADLTPEGHAGCPGHAAYLGFGFDHLDPATGLPLTDEQLAAWDNAADPDEDGDGDGQPYTGPEPVWGRTVRPIYVCTDPASHGHRSRWGGRAATATPAAGEPTDEQREARRAERRDVIESNKAWSAATTVRRDWLRGFAARKTAPKGSAAFVAAAIATDGQLLDRVGGNALAADLLGVTETVSYGRSYELPRLIEQAAEARAWQLTLIQTLAAYEDATSRDDWRHVSSTTRRYLTFLAAQGYPLADVERRACGDQAAAEDGAPPAGLALS